MKKCFKCKIKKPLSEFYKHPQMADGHLNKCKTCNRLDSIYDYKKNAKDKDWKEGQRTRGREKYRRLYVGTGKARPDNNKRWFDKFPEKRQAHLKSSSLKSPSIYLEKHHWSYNEEHFKDVIWATKKEHMKAHRFLIYDQEQKMYRRSDDNSLLDTKERHENYIRWCIQNKED